MGYISLFRKYRSESFGDLVGQEHIVRTISNFIATGKIPQAYLFCGTRGTGKTTVARILAKALNCEKGPTAEPCCQCPACVSIRNGNAVDVYEMDAASNRGVDDVEAIVDSVKYRPAELRYKVFIIDEAHQLSATAKDAFLKTLEEPPSYAVFILATTEAHKIPVTIRSRCQQFDFRRGTVESIGSRVAHVAECEHVTMTPEAVSLIARAANGSYRDSLSILEQVISFSGANITDKDVTGVLGLIEDDILFDISRAVRDRDAAAAFEYSGRLLSAGKDIRDAIPLIAGFFRDLLTVRIGADKTRGSRWEEQAARFEVQEIVRVMDVFLSAEQSLRYTTDARLVFELAFLKACAGAASPAAAPEVLPVRQQPRAEQPRAEQPKQETRPQPAEQPASAPAEKPVRVLQTKPAADKKERQAAGRSISIDNLRSFWKRYLNYVREKYRKEQLVKGAEKAVLRDYRDGTLFVSFAHTDGFICKLCIEEKKTLEQALEECYQFHINMEFETEPAPREAAPREADDARVVPPTPEGLETAPAPEEPPADREAVTVDNPRLTAEEPDNPLADPRYDDHPQLAEAKKLWPEAEIDTIYK
ncbi:MAG: DNA polymerase III subunit gamma/tau [Abditibacteriota bacterium]|nr:DNA polymerase III subunit gamma/tau [Abditibacteriota bacterium]